MEEGDWGENFMSSFWTWPGRWNTRLFFVFDFANLGGKVEDKDGEVEDANTGDNQVHDVEKRLPSDLQVEENICRNENLRRIKYHKEI